jgi:MFS family permease
MKTKIQSMHSIINITVIVSALGYFVDMYDLLLFGIVRVPSLKALGYTGKALTDNGVLLLNMQMAGMLIGGLIWGIIGDKKGRLNVLFGSILLYSAANIANAFVINITQYSIARFLAGVGLAGELGAAITLVSEVPKEHRGYGTAIVASVGIFGAVVAALVGDFLHWQTAYIVGGILGIILLLLRLKMFEPTLFINLKTSSVKKGDFLSLFTSKQRFFKYIKCMLIGLPFWYVIGILITFSPEFGKYLKIQEPVNAGQAIMYTYIGAVFGDIISGFGSQYIKSRKKTILAFLSMGAVFVFIYLFLSYNLSLYRFYMLCLAIGFSFGYWAVFVTIGAEQFGTNLRSTVTTTIPNFVRGLTVVITSSFLYLTRFVSIIESAIIVGIFVFIIAFLALWRLEESFHKDLDFMEQ